MSAVHRQPEDILPPSAASLSTRSSPSQVPPTPPPSLMIIGDSIVKHVHIANSITHCLPGATVPILLEKLPAVFNSLPLSITAVLVHIGTNDSALRTSEQTKTQFLRLVDFLDNSGITYFLSGPIPTLGGRDERFSRIASLNTWLIRLCQTHVLNFIDNFNLFWGRSSLFNRDGLHPNKRGSQMLAANLARGIRHHAVLTADASVSD